MSYNFRIYFFIFYFIIIYNPIKRFIKNSYYIINSLFQNSNNIIIKINELSLIITQTIYLSK